ncbi:MAG TPA: AMP-binding protein [Acidimicrobiales bacterium]|nr:AMP-binding protein [Acidimicrobiales bacterium]
MDEVISFGRRLTELAEARGDEIAVVFVAVDGTETSLTWGELEARANQFGHCLLGQGIGEGDLAIVALPNSLEHLIAAFGAWKAGASVLPLRHDLPPWERDRLLDLAGARIVVADWPDGPPGTMSTAELAATISFPAEPLPDAVPRWERAIASSGSTGRPKLIVSPKPGVMAARPPLEVLAGTADVQVSLGASPLYHTNGWQGGGPGCLLDGNRSILMERFDAEQAVEIIERHRVTIAILVPTMLLRMARVPGIGDRDLSSLAAVIYGGASIPEWVARRWLELIPPERFVFSYGSSEGLGFVVTTGDVWLERPGTTGRPVTCELKILDPEGNEVASGTVGEVHMRPLDQGPTFRYLGAEMLPATPDGFRSIGDMGWVDEDGFLYIADRRQDMIVSGGANVFPAEVEAALSEHPSIADQVVIGLPDPEWGHRVHAVLEVAPGTDAPTTDELRDFCRDRLAGYKVPKAFEIVDRILRTEAGKVNRGALVEQRTAAPTTAR